MLGSHGFNPNGAEVSQLPKLGKAHLRPPAEAAREMQSKKSIAQTDKPVDLTVEQKEDGSVRVTAAPNMVPVDVTVISIYPKEIRKPTLNFFGYKIDLGSKVDDYKAKYLKNYALTKSHNLMVARFAQLKTAFYGYLLSLLGCKPEDIKGLQRKAIADAKEQNKTLFAENEYNGEILGIVGGSKKMIRQQKRIIGEIRKQLMTQANNLGLKGYYTEERMAEIQRDQCRKISDKFREEKGNLEYQLAYFGVG